MKQTQSDVNMTPAREDKRKRRISIDDEGALIDSARKRLTKESPSNDFICQFFSSPSVPGSSPFKLKSNLSSDHQNTATPCKPIVESKPIVELKPIVEYKPVEIRPQVEIRPAVEIRPVVPLVESSSSVWNDIEADLNLW